MSQALLIESLQDLRRRVKMLSIAYGVGVVVAATVALVVAVVLIDWALALQFWPRAVVNIAALGVLGYALFRWVVRPALAKLSLTDLAGRLEHAFPQFDDRLRTTVNYHATNVPGSDAMKQRTVAEATRMAADVDLGKAVVLKPVWYSSAAAVGSVVLLVALGMLVDPSFRKIAVNHLLGGAEPWPKSVQIDMLDAMPRRVAVGQSVPVRLKLAKGNPKRVTVAYRYDDGRWTEEVMERGPDGVYSADLEARLDGSRQAGNLQIKVEAGDDDKVLPEVAIVPRLDVRGVIAHVKPPAYANLPAVPVNIAERPVVTAIGSEIALHVTFNKSLDTSKGIRLTTVEPGLTVPQIDWTFPNEGEAVGRFVAPAAFRPTTRPSADARNEPGKPAPPSTLRFVVRATDTDGFENTGTQEYQVIVHDDSMPTILIEEPKRSEDRTPDATVPLKAVAEDDYGFDAVQLVVEGKSPRIAQKAWAIDLIKGGSSANEGLSWAQVDSTVERRRFRLDFGWALAQLEGANLQPGDVLEFGLRVRDNFNLAGRAPHNPVDSARLKITIISHEQWDIVRENQLAQIKNEIGQVKKNVDGAKAEAQQQAKETAAKKELDEAQKATMGRLATAQSTATAQAKQIAQKLDELVKKSDENKSPEKGMTETAKDVAKQLENAAENPMKAAAGELNEAKDQKADPKASAEQKAQSAQKSAAAMEKAAENQGKASEQLAKAMEKLNDFGGLQPAIAKIQAIKDAQDKLAKDYKDKMKDALGKKPEDLTDKQKADLKEMTDKQDKLAEETAKALKEMDAKADKLAKMDPSASKAMKEAAQTGQQQGIPQKQSNKKEESGASQKMEQNQQANAQTKHKEIELGLDMILNKLQEAERRKLAELQKDLAALQELLTELIARQAGHNIDNLLIQDPSAKKVNEITEADRKELFAQAKRDLEKLAELKPQIGVVTPSQEQTENNARDLVKKAEALPDPVPATKITASAAKMEQAIVFLRKSQLPEAYAPNQVEALKLLAEAKSAVDQAKKQADDKAKEEDEETIKAAYVKLLEAQKKLDEETTKIDAADRDAEGNLPFLVGRRLGQLPGEQGELSAKAEELGKKLEQLKSVVYVWANKDIVSSMGEVREDLAKPETGKGTQAEQKRIEEQLAAMIDNLNKKKEEDKKFAEKSSGGGGGGGGEPPPSMPTDIELRLLRDLQQAVNKSTNKLDAAKDRDAQKLLGLGGRQGELRNLLDTLLQQSSKGKTKLAPEPDKKDQLPEEANADEVEDQEFVKGLLEDNLQADTVEKSVKLTGDRMARSRQRLALDNDPGKVTQEIQKRIILDLEDMIKLAQQQQQQQKPGKPKPGGKPGKPKPGEDEGQQQVAGKPKPGNSPKPNGQTPATESKDNGGADPEVDASKVLSLKEGKVEWGGITQREREAVMQGAGEKVFKKYEKFTDDYYRELAKRASER